MKISYATSMNATDARRMLEKARPTLDKKVWVENKKGELYLNLEEFRMSTTFKMVFKEEYLVLKYSGFFSCMNIVLGIIMGWLPIVLSFILFFLFWMTEDMNFAAVVCTLANVLLGIGFLELLLLKHRRNAKVYISKILGIQTKQK